MRSPSLPPEKTEPSRRPVDRAVDGTPTAHPNLLEEAVAVITDAVGDGSQAWMADSAEIKSACQRLTAGIVAIQSGAGVVRLPTTLPDSLLCDRLVDAVRVQVLCMWRSRAGRGLADPEGSLDLLSALEEYQSRLWSREDGADDGLAHRLSQPGAFELVAELAHDIRSPLNSVLFLSEVLRSGHSGPVSDHQRRQLGLIYSATLGMIALVSDVMEIASEGRGIGDEEYAPFSIGRVFESVKEMVGPMAEEKGLALEFHRPDHDLYLGFPSSLGRVILNLTTNALKFTEEGRVAITADPLGEDRMEFSVADSGVGIPQEQFDELFRPFRQTADRSRFFFSGSGLGLSIAKRLVQRMDSELKVHSAPKEGSRFYFVLQLPPAPEQ